MGWRKESGEREGDEGGIGPTEVERLEGGEGPDGEHVVGRCCCGEVDEMEVLWRGGGGGDVAKGSEAVSAESATP